MPTIPIGPHFEAFCALRLLKAPYLNINFIIIILLTQLGLRVLRLRHLHCFKIDSALKKINNLVLGLDISTEGLVIEFEEQTLGALELHPRVAYGTQVLPWLIQVLDVFGRHIFTV